MGADGYLRVEGFQAMHLASERCVEKYGEEMEEWGVKLGEERRRGEDWRELGRVVREMVEGGEQEEGRRGPTTTAEMSA